jgi:hypothetical protein
MSTDPVQEADLLAELEAIIFTDPGQRGLADLWTPGCLRAIVDRLSICPKSQPSYVLTGFCVSGTSETDGPLGSSILCATLRSLGFNSQLLCDSASAPVVAAAALSNPVSIADSPGSITDPAFVIAIERPGRSRKTGDYRTMRGIALPNIVPLDLLFPSADAPKPYLTIAVGDGGNEAGTGNIADRVAQCIPFGADICTAACCDVLAMAGVSNWGALAIAAALAIRARNRELGQTFVENCGRQPQMLRDMVRAGAYDGRTGIAEESVDGMPFENEHRAVTDAICDRVRRYLGLAM